MITVAVPLALVVYAVVVAFVLQRWISAIAAVFVAALLWQRHRRARFAAYIFLSAVTARAVMTHVWTIAVFAIVMIAVLQLPSARRAWPSLLSGRINGDRMAPP